MKKKVLVIYYTQTGQLLNIVRSVTGSLHENHDVDIVYEELRPKPQFPFPWSSDEFFQAFPESVMAIPCEIEPLAVRGQESFDLIIIAWQPWYLSPSIPFHAFFQHAATRGLLSGKPVITVIGSRNMWVMAHQKIKDYIQHNGGKLVGNIVLYDKAPNLLSVISIMRWMLTGKRDRYLKIIPPAGVSEADIKEASRFGTDILESLLSGEYGSLQDRLIRSGAVDVHPDLVMFEKRGIKFFRIWAGFILKKGAYGSKARKIRLRAFKYYLLTVIYLVSPLAKMAYILTRPFRSKAIQKQKSLCQSL